MSIEDALRPKTFDELKMVGAEPPLCQRCGQCQATHTLSITAARRGVGRGSMVSQLRQVPVCEGCGVKVFALMRKALRA